MKDVLLKRLFDFGLSNKEAKIYLALLELEVATVQEIAKQSEVNRSSAYVVIESLAKKGFVGISDDKKVRQYVAASPEILLYSADNAAKKQTDIKSGIETILPELKALHKGNKRRPVIKIFEGENGAKDAYLDLFLEKNVKELRTFANPLNILKAMPNLLEEYDVERGRRKIKLLAINAANKEILDFYNRAEFPPKQPAEIVLIPEKKYKFPFDLGVYGDKISFVSPKDNFGIIIENHDLAEMFKICFNLAWEEAKRLDKTVRNKNLKIK